MRGDDVMSADGEGWEPSRILYPGCTAAMFLTEASHRTEAFYRAVLSAALTGDEPGLEQIAQALAQLPDGASPKLLLLKTHLRQLCRLGAEIGDRLEEDGLGGASGYLEPEPAALLVNEVLHHHFGETTLESLEMVPEEAPHTEEALAILELDQSLPEGMPVPAALRHTDQEETSHDEVSVAPEGQAVSRPTPSGTSQPERALTTRQEALLGGGRPLEAFDAPAERGEKGRGRGEGAASHLPGGHRPQRASSPPWLEALPDTGADPWLTSSPLEEAPRGELAPAPSERQNKRPASGAVSPDSSVSLPAGPLEAPAPPAQSTAQAQRVRPSPPPVPTSALSDAESHALWQALGPPEEEASLAMFPALPAPPPRQRTPKRSVDDAAATWEHAAEPLPAQWQKSMEELAFEPQPGDNPPLPPDPALQPDPGTTSRDARRLGQRSQDAAVGGASSKRLLPLGARPAQASGSPAGEKPLDGAGPTTESRAVAPESQTDGSDALSHMSAPPPPTPGSRNDATPSAPDASTRAASAAGAEDTLEILDESGAESEPFFTPPVHRGALVPDAVSLPLHSHEVEASTSLPYHDASDKTSQAWQDSASDWNSAPHPGDVLPTSSDAADASTSAPRPFPAAGAGKAQSAMDVFRLVSHDAVLAQASEPLASAPLHPDGLESPDVSGSPGLPPHPAEADLPPQPPSTALTVLERLASASSSALPDLLWDASSVLAEAPEEDLGAHSLLRILTRLSKAEQSNEQLQQGAVQQEQRRKQDAADQTLRSTLEAQLASAQGEAKALQGRLETAEAKLARLGKQDTERAALENSLEHHVQTLERADILLDQLFFADLIDWSGIGEDAFPARGALAEKFARLSETLESWRSITALHTEQQEELRGELDAMKELLTDKEHLILSQDRSLAERDERIQALQERLKRQTGETARFKILALWQNARVQILELRRKLEAAMSAKSLFGRRKMPEPAQMRELVLAMDHIEDVLERLQGRMDPSDFRVAESDLEYLRKFTGAFRRYLEKTGSPVVRTPAPAKRAAPRKGEGRSAGHPAAAQALTEDVVVPEPKAIDMTSESFQSSLSEPIEDSSETSDATEPESSPSAGGEPGPAEPSP